MSVVPGEVRKTVTVLFADVAGSTALGERLDPESLRRVMSRYFAEARTCLEAHGGTVEKFIGDAVMAVFGIPTVHEDDALRAVTAALEMRDRLHGLNLELEGTWGVSIVVRTGLNTGEVVAGDPGAGETLVTGDAVNIAARLEQAAEPGEILIGANTYRLVQDAVVADPVPPVEAKGKAEPLRAFSLSSVVSGAAGRARRMDAPLVGRQAELQRLREAFDVATRDLRCRLVTVVGAAGEGKSRLVAEFLSDVEQRATVLHGRCLSYGEGITFWPIAEIVRQVAGIAEGDRPEEARRKLAKIGPEGTDSQRVVDGMTAALGLGDRAAESREIFWSVRRLLEALTQERPVVAVFEDLHWAEPTLLDLLEYLVDFVAEAPLLLIGTARPDLTESRPSLGSRPGEESIRLHPLSENESDQLISGLVEEGDIPADARRRIAETAEGNPLFVEEILRMLVDDELLRRREGRWEVTGDLSGLVLPTTIAALLSARLERLTDGERGVMGRASVVGTEFWWDAVVHLFPEQERAEVGADLQALVRKELIRPARSTFLGEDAFRFSHNMVRDAAYAAVPKETRADLHERFADWVDRAAGDGGGEFEEIVGHHLEQAYRLRTELSPGRADPELASRAAARLASAGRRALARADMPAAENLLSRATQLLPSADPQRIRLLPDLAEGLYDLGRIREAEDLLRDCAEAALAVGDRALRARALLRGSRVGVGLRPTPTLEEMLEAATELVSELETLGDAVGAAEGHLFVAQIQIDVGRMEDADVSLDRALAHAERLADRRRMIHGLELRAWVLELGPAPAPMARRGVLDILDRAAVERSLRLEGWTVIPLALIEAMEGRFEEARSLVDRGNEILGKLGMRMEQVAMTSLKLGEVELLAGDPEAAERALRAGYEALAEMGEKGRMSSRAAGLAEAVYQQGRYDEAWEFAEIADRATSGDDLEPQLWIKGVRAKVLARRGDARGAEAVARDAVRQAEATDWLTRRGDALMDLAEVLELVTRSDEAGEVLREAVDRYDRKGNVVASRKARARLDTVEGRS